MMLIIQLTSVVIVASYLLLRARDVNGPGSLLIRFVLFALMGAAAEESVIGLYRFYEYAPDWSLFICRVPLAIALIWPVVLQSALDIAEALEPRRSYKSKLLFGAIVASDAALIEPIAVHAGLWSWSEPGLFAVPPIALLGWGYFAVFVVWAIACGGKISKARRAVRLVIALVGLHLSLLATWWGLLRWVNTSWPNSVAVGLTWTISLALCLLIIRYRSRLWHPVRLLLLRLPAALFFFILLGVSGPQPSLVIYALAFAPPYLVLICCCRGKEDAVR